MDGSDIGNGLPQLPEGRGININRILDVPKVISISEMTFSIGK